MKAMNLHENFVNFVSIQCSLKCDIIKEFSLIIFRGVINCNHFLMV